MVIFKVGDDFTSIANSARRFLDQQDQMDQRVHNVFAGLQLARNLLAGANGAPGGRTQGAAVEPGSGTEAVEG